MDKSILRTASEGTFWISFSTLLVKVVGIATVFIMLSRLGAAQYGNLELALSITSLFSIFMLPGIDALVVADMGSEIGKGSGRQARVILQTYLVLQYVLALCAFAIVFFGATFFASTYNTSTHYIQLVSLQFLIGPLRTTFGVLFRVQLKFILQSLLTFIEETFKLISIASLFVLVRPSVTAVLVSIIISQLATLLVLTPSFISGMRTLSHGATSVLRWWYLITGHGLWTLLSSYAGNVGRALRLWIIQKLLGPEAVGLYAVASGLIGHTTALVPLSTVLTPLLAQYVHEKVRFMRLLVKGIKYQLIANIGLIGVGFFVFPPILRWLFPQYMQAFPLFQLMLFALIPGAVISVVTPAFFALKLQRSFFASMVLKTVLTVVFDYAGIVLFGIWGLAFESIATSVVQAFERARSLRRHVPDLPPAHMLYSMRFDEDDRLVLEKVQGFALRGYRKFFSR